MITYGSIQFDFEKGSFKLQKTNRTNVRTYPGKNTADYFDLGKEPTHISCNILAHDTNDQFVDRVAIESMLHTPVKRELHLLNRGEYYKLVIPDTSFDVGPVGTTKSGAYIIPANFIALEPVPYSIDTGQVMY